MGNRMIKDSSTGRFVHHVFPNICSIADCSRKVHGHGFCALHYNRFRRHGSPFSLKQRPRGQGTITRSGYKAITINGKRIFEHRHIMEQYLGRKLRDDEIVHHKDENKINNHLSNLVIVSRSDHPKFHPEVLENLSLGPHSPKRRQGTNR
jgi:hypothetical protein